MAVDGKEADMCSREVMVIQNALLYLTKVLLELLKMKGRQASISRKSLKVGGATRDAKIKIIRDWKMQKAMQERTLATAMPLFKLLLNDFGERLSNSVLQPGAMFGAFVHSS